MSNDSHPAKNLTQKQERFVGLVADGCSYTEAYRQAYNVENMQPDTIHRKACGLMQNGKVRARFTELQADTQRLALWRREQSIKTLAAIARDDGANSSARVQAVRELNAMHGYNEPIKFDHGGLGPSRIEIVPLEVRREEVEQELRELGIDPEKVALEE